MNRRRSEKVYVPAPDYDDFIQETPEPDLPIPEPDYEAPSWQVDYQYSPSAKAVTPPSRHSASSQRSRGSIPREFRENVRQSPSQAYANEQNHQASGSSKGNARDAEVQVQSSNDRSEYEYRIDRLVPSPEPQHRSTKESIKNYIKAVGGVPVLPPPMPKNQWAYPQNMPSIDVAENLAFRQHVLNHRKFDTLHSFRSCDDCAICRSMREDDNEAIASLERRQRGKGKTGESPFLSGKTFEKLEEDALEMLDELEDYMTTASKQKAIPNIRAQVLEDVKGRNADEIDARRGELLEVLEQKNLWWKVRNSKGRSGWISVQDIYVLSAE